jgi:hypothetical protein
MAKYKKLALSPSGDIINRLTGTLDRSKTPLEIRGNRVYKKGRLYGYLGKQTKTQQKLSKALDERRQKRKARKLKKQGIIPSVKTEPVKVTEKPKKNTSKPVSNDEIVDEIIDEIEEINDVVQPVEQPTEDIDQYEIELSEQQIKKIEEELFPDLPRPISEESLLMITDINKWGKFVEREEPILPDYLLIKQEESNLVRSVDARVKAGQISATEGEVIKDAWKQAKTDQERDYVWEYLKMDDPESGFEYDPEIQTLNTAQAVFIE